MHKPINPPSIGAPGPTYSHGIEVPAAARQLHISGQIGVDASGRVGRDALEQAQIAFANVAEILKSAGMSTDDLVRIRCYLVSEADLAAFKEARAQFLGACKPASSLLIVKALADPAWRVEVEAVAARS